MIRPSDMVIKTVQQLMISGHLSGASERSRFMTFRLG